MSPLLKVQAEKLSREQLLQGVVENIITSDELFGVLPFKGVDGKAYIYNRELDLGDAAFVDVNADITESAATFTKITQELRRLIGDADVDNFLQTTMSDESDQTAVQISKKSKVVGRKYAEALINGDSGSDPLVFDGLLNLVAAGQSTLAGANGAAFALDHLDWLIDQVKVGEQMAFIMHSRTRRSYVTLLRALGGTNPEHIQLPGLVQPILSYRGIPILKNDWIPVDQTEGTGTALTSIFLAGMDDMEGLCGLNASKLAGVQVEDVGKVQNRDAERWRVKWYCGLALHSELALAMVSAINN